MENINEVLGLPIDYPKFADGKVRTIQPVPMSKFAKLIDALQYVNAEKMWANFVWEEGQEALSEVLALSFPTEDIEAVMDNINAGNFKELMNNIMKINGIEFNNKIGDEKNVTEV